MSNNSNIFSERSLFAKIKEASSHTLIYGFGSVLQSVLGFILIPLYTSYFTAEIYGVFALITICGALASHIFYLGIAGALSRSYYDYEDLNERKKVVSTSIFLTLIGVSAQIVVGFFFKEKLSILLLDSSQYDLHIFLILISTAIAFFNNLLYVILRFERKSKQVVLVNLSTIILSLFLISLLLVIFKLGIMAPIVGILITQIMTLFILFGLTKKSYSFIISKPELKIQLFFGIPTMVGALGLYLMVNTDRFLLSKFTTLEDVGIYSVGFLLGSVINILLITPFSQIWAPMRMEYRNDKNARNLYKLVLFYYFIIGWFITVLVSLFSKELIILISGKPEYLSAYRVVPIIMVGFLIQGSMGILDLGINFSRKTFYITYIYWFGFVLNFFLNYFLIPIYGYMAAAYNFMASSILVVVLAHAVSNRLFSIQLDSKRLVQIFLSSLIVITMGLYITISNFSLIGLVVLKLILLFVLFFYWYVFVLNINEKRNILRVLQLSS